MYKLMTLAIFSASMLSASWAHAQSLSSDEHRLINLVNQARTQANLEPVQADESLSTVARSHSLDMARNRFFSHESPTTGSMGDRLNAAGVPFRRAGENIALDENIDSAHRALMNSEHHRHNVLNPEYTHLGVGVVRVGERVMVTQAFMRPQPGARTAPAAPTTSEVQAPEEPTVPASPETSPQSTIPESVIPSPIQQTQSPFDLLAGLMRRAQQVIPSRTPLAIPEIPALPESDAIPEAAEAPQTGSATPGVGMAPQPETPQVTPEQTAPQRPGISVVGPDGTRQRYELDAATLLRVLSAL